MIKYICDLCGKEVDKINTVIIYKKPIQYCGNCAKRVYTIKQSFNRERHEEYLEYESRLKQKEEEIFNNLRRN